MTTSPTRTKRNGYSVLQASVKVFRDKQTLVGTFHEVTVGACLVVEGEWRVDKRYGRQFAAQSWEEELPATIVGIEKYVGSGLVKDHIHLHPYFLSAGFCNWKPSWRLGFWNEYSILSTMIERGTM